MTAASCAVSAGERDRDMARPIVRKSVLQRIRDELVGDDADRERLVVRQGDVIAKHLEGHGSGWAQGLENLLDDIVQGEVASLLGISRQTLFDILREKQPVTPATALRFGKLLGNGPELWIDLQRGYDLHAAEKQLGKVLAKIPTITAA